MPMHLEIIRARDFIKLGASGEMDLPASHELLVKLARACRVRQIGRAMLDVRDAHAELTPENLAELVRDFDDIGFERDQRLALLHKGDPSHRARVFALIGRLRGWNVRAFDSFEEAMVWLAEDEPDHEPVKPEEGSLEIPVEKSPEPQPGPDDPRPGDGLRVD